MNNALDKGGRLGGAFGGAVRMAAYSALLVVALTAGYHNPRIREAYYYWQWQGAKTPEDQERYFEALWKTHPSRERICQYSRVRGDELIRQNDWDAIDLLIHRGCGKALAPALTRLLTSATGARENRHRIRSSAATALASIGHEARGAVPALINVFETDRDPVVATSVANALLEIGDPAVVALGKRLKSAKSLYAAEMLGRFGDSALPVLAKAFETEQSDLRYHIGQALIKVGKSSVPVFVKALNNKNEYIRKEALNCLRQLGTAARSALPSVQKALEDDAPSVRECAATTMREIQSEEKAPASGTDWKF